MRCSVYFWSIREAFADVRSTDLWLIGLVYQPLSGLSGCQAAPTCATGTGSAGR